MGMRTVGWSQSTLEESMKMRRTRLVRRVEGGQRTWAGQVVKEVSLGGNEKTRRWLRPTSGKVGAVMILIMLALIGVMDHRHRKGIEAADVMNPKFLREHEAGVNPDGDIVADDPLLRSGVELEGAALQENSTEEMPVEEAEIVEGLNSLVKEEFKLNYKGKTEAKEIPAYLTNTDERLQAAKDKWGSEGVGFYQQKIPSMKNLLEKGERLVLDSEGETNWKSFARIRKEKLVATNEIKNVKVAVLEMEKRLMGCVDFEDQKTALGGWDYSLHLYFLQHAAKISEADFLFVPFYQYCYQAKKDCAKKTIMEMLTYELDRARNFTATAGQPDLPILVPMSHDFGACAKYHIQGYEQGMPYFEPLRSTIVLTPNGDFDQNCFDISKDIVVPAFSTFPNFHKQPNDLDPYFGDEKMIQKTSLRTNLVFAGFSKDFSQRAPKVRGWLRDKSNWKDASRVVLDKAGNLESYVRTLNNTQFCLSPPGVVGWTGRVWENMYAGCIPVIIAEKTRYPFEEMIDFTKFAIRFSFDELDKIESELANLSPERMDELQAEVLKVRNHFRWPHVSELKDKDIERPSPIHNVLRELAFHKQKLKA